MRKVNVLLIRKAVEELCLKANFELRSDILRALKRALRRETDARARRILRTIVENARIAKSKRLAICQDTGMVIVHLQIGQDVRIIGGSPYKAINDGVRDAYVKGYLRKSVVSDCLFRKNTRTNTPAVIVTEMVNGDKVRMDVSLKGFGSENKSRIKMLKPTASMDEVKDFIVEVAKEAGPDACPPFVIGIGIGGTFETAAMLAGRALLRPIDKGNTNKHLARFEKKLMDELNSLGIGPMALGGRTTVLGVNVLDHPTHIAGFPVAVNMSCHATRSASKVL
jgi:fumarate hydratase subunit alpha